MQNTHCGQQLMEGLLPSLNSPWVFMLYTWKDMLTLPLSGVSLAANQEDETDMETFQMEIDKETRKCTFRTSQGNYWALVAHGGIQSTDTEVWVYRHYSVKWIHQVHISYYCYLWAIERRLSCTFTILAKTWMTVFNFLCFPLIQFKPLLYILTSMFISYKSKYSLLP